MTSQSALQRCKIVPSLTARPGILLRPEGGGEGDGRRMRRARDRRKGG